MKIEIKEFPGYYIDDQTFEFWSKRTKKWKKISVIKAKRRDKSRNEPFFLSIGFRKDGKKYRRSPAYLIFKYLKPDEWQEGRLIYYINGDKFDYTPNNLTYFDVSGEEWVELEERKGYYFNKKTSQVYFKNGKVQKYGLSDNGYRILGFGNPTKHYKAHRIIFKYLKPDEWNESLFIDHINGDRSDNRIENLRMVTIIENSYNRKGVRGYTKVRATGRYCSKITANKKSIYLGTFDTPEEAHSAYLKAKKKYHNIDRIN